MFKEKIPGDNFEAYTSKILTNGEYGKIPNLNEKAASHSFVLENAGKFLSYIGGPHTNNPEHPLFSQIQTEFDLTQPGIVLVEGRRYINTEKDNYRKYFRSKTLDDCIKDGEPDFTLKLAVDAGIDFESPEPSFGKEIQHLFDSGYSQRDLHKYYTYRLVYQYQRSHPSGTVSSCRGFVIRLVGEVRC